MPQSTRKSSNKKRVSIILSLTFLVGLGIYAYQTLPQILFAAPASDPALMVPDVAVPSSDLVMPHKKTKAKTMTDIDMMVNELSDRLRRQFAENIHLLAIQVSLRNLRDDLNRSYPAQGQALFVRILKLAFPEFVDAIIKAIALMDEYDVWLQGMLLSLNDMNPLEQQGVLWEKRRALFGDAAIQIWQEEISAEQERQITMRNTMEILDKAYDTQMQERLYLLQSTFEETYADKIQTMVVDPKGVLSQVFFGFDSVQRDLAALSPEERQAQIDEIRKSMGFPEEQIKYLSESDQKREKRWQKGYAYMEARAAAEVQYSGEALEYELDKIREKHFAHEASTIKKEEEGLEFFRYKRPRVYGRN
tara:strand:- start:18717 stop:19802 length:1086 start_codon:yes stop_codon:yes gene_type:complete